jgi:hypothetical protein
MHLGKPVDPEELIAAIASLVGGKDEPPRGSRTGRQRGRS